MHRSFPLAAFVPRKPSPSAPPPPPWVSRLLPTPNRVSTTPPHASSITSPPPPPAATYPYPKCYCGTESVPHTSQIRGPSFGRQYVSCPKRGSSGTGAKEGACKFFKWSDQVTREDIESPYVRGKEPAAPAVILVNASEEEVRASIQQQLTLVNKSSSDLMSFFRLLCTMRRCKVFDFGGTDLSDRSTDVSYLCLKCGCHGTDTVAVFYDNRKKSCRCTELGTSLWAHRYHEFVALCKSRHCTLLMTESEWARQVTGDNCLPPIRCDRCADVVTSTRIHQFHREGLGCSCLRKTQQAAFDYALTVWKKHGTVLWEAPLKAKGRNLRCDIVLVNHHGDWIGVIEVDGLQHAQPVQFFGGQKSYEQTVERDQLKDAEIASNGWKILRIPHTLQRDEHNGFAPMRKKIDEFVKAIEKEVQEE